MRRFWVAGWAVLAFGANDDWARWRGPYETGMARGDAPVQWSLTENIAWKTTIPGRGFSSPVLWGDKIFLTTAVPAKEIEAGPAAGGGGRGAGGGAGSGVEHRFQVMALDRRTGKVIWERTAVTATPHEGYHRKYGSFASNSPVTDGRMVYAFFGSRGLYAYDLDGKQMWKKEFPPMRMRLQFGEGTAVVLHEDKLILSCDQESDSFIVVVDKRTGKELWRKSRDEVSAWSPPLVVEYEGKKQMIVAASAKVRAYDIDTGNVIWECGGLGSNVIPAPVTYAGMVFVMSGHREPNLLAIKLGRTGDLTGTDAVAWTNQRGNSYTPSPVLHEGKLYFVTDNGMISCFDAKTGKPFYHQIRLPKPYNFKASPVGANGKLYLSTEQGDIVVVKLSEEYEVLATNSMGDEFFVATPAIVGGNIYLRSATTLYAVGK
ncbi:MAG: PQQ-binding-like beta-propeller repeat protein [Bryobacterales bacterium]|nr:PQQ-binding-like beta-propeller repeat protein [Bryobacterales bacterium]